MKISMVYKCVKTTFIKTAKALATYLMGCQGPTVFDTETTGLGIDARLIGMSFWDFKNDPVFVFTDQYFTEGIPLKELVRVCNAYFPKLKVIGHNIKYDYGVLLRNDIVDPQLVCDTSSMVHLHNPDYLKKLELRVKQDLKHDKATYEQIIEKKWPKTLDEWFRYRDEGIITPENMGNYGGDDAYWTGKLYQHYEPKMGEDEWRLMERIEIPLIYTLRDMHDAGVNIDQGLLVVLDRQLEREIADIKNGIYDEAGAVFNLKSPKQIADILYNKMGLPCYARTKTGAPSTDAKQMKRLANEGYPMGEKMVEFSQAYTLHNNFVKAIPRLIDMDGRLRCSFNIDIARTGRLSSNGPNLQNQPNNKRWPIRKAYIPSEGCKLLVADLSQIELRVMAHVSGDKVMSQAFWDGADIHQAVAEKLGITRKAGKVANFGVIYGMGAEGLAELIGCTVAEAKNIIRGYGSTYKGYYRWKEETERFAEKNKCVYNIFGRIRRFAYDRNDKRSYYGMLRQACNTVIQGSAADIIKLNMIALHKEYQRRNLKSRLLLTVHDELVVDSPYNEVEEAFGILIDKMENTVKLSVPIIADGKVVDTWFNMKDDEYESLLPDFQFQAIPTYLLNNN